MVGPAAVKVMVNSSNSNQCFILSDDVIEPGRRFRAEPDLVSRQVAVVGAHRAHQPVHRTPAVVTTHCLCLSDEKQRQRRRRRRRR